MTQYSLKYSELLFLYRGYYRIFANCLSIFRPSIIWRIFDA